MRKIYKSKGNKELIFKTSINGNELENGSELLEIIDVSEESAVVDYSPVTHALVVVKCDSGYLMGYNYWRKRWEIFGGCREENEGLRECISREVKEELGLTNLEFKYIGLMHFNMSPSYFNGYTWKEEYGALYGITLPDSILPEMEKHREDREEIIELKFYEELKGKEQIAQIDEALLKFYK